MTSVQQLPVAGELNHTVVIKFDGHLTLAFCEQELAGVTTRLQADAANTELLFDCRTMTGYDAEARTRFVEWHKQHRERLGRVAIVTDNPLWHVVISAMSLAARHQMQSFTTRVAAETWLRNG
jgi:MFS superfamily sulfate permease-like transporter